MKRRPSRFLQPSLFAVDAPLPPLGDDAARRTAREETGRSLLLQASAGTGKTTTLIDRILKLVLVDGKRLSRIAAMTFTEKAAAEMRTRLREELERDRSPRAAAARSELDRAEIGTLHAFAARLLRERPVEAGVDPAFVTPDDTTQTVLFDDAWEGWVLSEAHDEASPLVKAVRAGAAIAEIQALARELFTERFLVASATLPTDSLAEVRRELTELVLLLESILFQTPAQFRGIKSAKAIERVHDETRALLALDEPALAAWAPVSVFEHRRPNVWTAETIALVDDAKERFRALTDRFRSLAREPLLVSLVDCLRAGFLAEVDAEKRACSFVDFDDLLLRARDLLRHHAPVRDHFRNRFDTLIVDEFQDTDPVQAEIVLRLAAPEPQTAGRWDDLVPAPGRLFVVGDPKQSIYRFRRADVESYRSIASRFDERDRLTLTANFRSTPAILDFVNALFERIMGGPRKAWESPYSPLSPSRPDAPRGAPPVLLLPPAPVPHGGKSPVDELKRREAWAVANLLRRRFDGRWREIAVLVPRNLGVELFHEVFTEAGIPAALEGGTSYFRREETAAVVSALHAIDDPTEGVEVVAALKSFLFGFSDVELLEAAEAGGRFDDAASLPPGSPIAGAFALLARLRASRHARPLAETLSDLLESRFAHLAIQEGAVVNPLQGLANLDRLLLVARDLDGQGLSFTRAVRQLTKRLLDAQAEPRAYEEAGDAVRLMTLHKAKGLQFDIVVVAGLGLAEDVQKSGRRSFRCDRPEGEWGVTLKIGDVTVATPGHRRIAAADRLRERAENERELYVALTRPKRHLVLSLFRKLEVTKDGSVKDDLASSVLGDLSWALPGGALDPALVEYADADTTERRAPLPRASTADAAPLDVTAERLAVEERLASVRRSRSRLLRRAGEHERAETLEDAPRELRDAAPGDRALRVGIAVHETMERLLAPVPPTLSAALAGVEPEIADEVRKLVATLEASDVTVRARRASRRFVELPLLYAAADGALVEGKIDLLFEEPDGYVLVDWKTDRIDSPADRARLEASYAPQLAAYGEGLRAVLGPGARIKETRLVFARG